MVKKTLRELELEDKLKGMDRTVTPLRSTVMKAPELLSK